MAAAIILYKLNLFETIEVLAWHLLTTRTIDLINPIIQNFCSVVKKTQQKGKNLRKRVLTMQAVAFIMHCASGCIKSMQKLQGYPGCV